MFLCDVLKVQLVQWSVSFVLLCWQNESEMDTVSMQAGAMAALLIIGGMDSRPRIGGLISVEGCGEGIVVVYVVLIKDALFELLYFIYLYHVFTSNL